MSMCTTVRGMEEASTMKKHPSGKGTTIFAGPESLVQLGLCIPKSSCYVYVSQLFSAERPGGVVTVAGEEAGKRDKMVRVTELGVRREMGKDEVGNGGGVEAAMRRGALQGEVRVGAIRGAEEVAGGLGLEGVMGRSGNVRREVEGVRERPLVVGGGRGEGDAKKDEVDKVSRGRDDHGSGGIRGDD